MNADRHSQVRAGFRARLAAVWVDLFVIFMVASLIVTLTDLTRFRVALEPLCILVGAAYGAILLAGRGQTVGKVLAGIAVAPRIGGTLRGHQVLLREVVGKWGLGVAVPLALGRALAGQAWVPTVHDALILSAVLLLSLIHYLIARRAWYDQLAGTFVARTAGAPGRPRLAFAALMGAALLGFGAAAVEFAARGRLPRRLAVFRGTRSTAPYVSFLQRAQPAPVDYVLDLFERYDVVVLCERLHPEVTQWDFIDEVVSDPRFVDRVGHVFTEYGQTAMQGYLDRFLAADGLAEREVQERVIHIMRHPPVWPVWVNTNFWRYLTRLHELNRSLPPARRIRHHFTDMSVGWKDLTPDAYRAYRRSLGDRDAHMAQRVVEEMDRLAGESARPPKCLVVMNYRHAFDLTGATERFNAFEYLKDAFGDRAANVLLNTGRPVIVPPGDRVLFRAPVAGGVWDAAFERTGNRPAGFDFEGSPFGRDPFDLFPFRPEVRERLAYRDVFTGFVFTHPLPRQYTQLGVPGYFAGFEDEALRRATLIGEGYRRTIERLIDRERRGEVPVERAVVPPASKADLSLLALASAGWLIGVVLFASARRTSGSPTGRG